MIPVAGYCRVSTDKEDQANSFEAQKDYFRSYINSRPDWELFAIYADQGITGTSTGKRTQFNRMLKDAYEGKFRILLTKEVSRFSRNILDTIRYTRELRAMGIGVIFLNDRIHTLEPEGEMLLSFLASLAQEESRRTSARVVWGQTRQMEKGVVFGRSLLGYDVTEGKLTVNEEGAGIVREIFHRYALEQVPASKIAADLTEQGCLTAAGNTQWTAGAIIRILKNEKYAGDLVQKKTYTPDYLSHEKRINKGQVPLVTIADHHEPIVSRELWELAQERMAGSNRHNPVPGGHSCRYAFSGRIRCGQCGKTFIGRFKYLRDGSRIRRWSCATAAREGADRCNVGKLLRDEDAWRMLHTALGSLGMDLEGVIRRVTELTAAGGNGGQRSREPDLRRQIRRLQQKKEAVMDACFSGQISGEDMQRMNRRYDRRLEALLNQTEQPQRRQLSPEGIASEIRQILLGRKNSEVFCKTLVESITVFRDRHMELRLNGLPLVFHFREETE